MIALQSDCLIFQLANGESIPCSAEMISVEIVGDARGTARSRNAPARRRLRLSLFQERTGTRDRHRRRICRRAGKSPAQSRLAPSAPAASSRDRGEIIETDLRRLARESADSLELFFFPRLRDELRAQLRQSPRVVRFRGLRGCVKQLAGARRWSHRCEKMQDQIVGYLRECLTAEPEQNECALVVE